MLSKAPGFLRNRRRSRRATTVRRRPEKHRRYLPSATAGNRLLDGFEGSMTSSRWATIAKCSQDTAYRGIAAQLDLGLLIKFYKD